jgi:hypothetical protein
MKSNIERLGPFFAKGKHLNVVVETPKGSRVKYAYDPKSGFFNDRLMGQALSKETPLERQTLKLEERKDLLLRALSELTQR